MKKDNEFILDCSVTMTWCFSEESTKKSLAIQEKLSKTSCYVPGIWSLEVNNVLRSAIHQKRISVLQAKRFKYLLLYFPIKMDLKSHDLNNDAILEIALMFNLSCYDAAYLELALREKLPLATLDHALSKAAKSAHIELLL